MHGKTTIEEKVLKTIQTNQLIQAGDSLVIGVSGGPDSMCLLNILVKQTKIPCTIQVAHINHQIREEADQDEEYVRQYCKKNNINFYAKRIDIIKYANTNKIGTEEAGRKIRYEFFEEIKEKTKSSKIATAHNQNDSVETVFMKLIRGSGLTGLRGIEVIRENKYIRPLIQCQREEIEEYCKQNNLKPRMDQTNQDNQYTRNKIRNCLIPYIQQEFNPNLVPTIERLSNIVKQEDNYIQEQMKQKYKEILQKQENKQIVLDLKNFNQLETVIKNRMIRYIINDILKLSFTIENIHIKDIIKLCDKNIGNKYLLPNKKIKILVKKNQIFFMSLL